MRSILSSARTAACACVCALFAVVARAEPANGWWWNANESGRGFFIEMTGGVIYLAGYFYDNTGRATWLTSGGVVEDPYRYSGTLQSYRSGETLFGAYRAPAPAVDVGPVLLEFTDDEHGSITWPGGTVPIERQIFGVGSPSFQPGTGWWWDEAASGTGFSIEVQGPNAFVVTFMYDDSGNPVWYYTAGPMTSPTHYEGDLLEFAGGQTLTGPYRPPQPPTVIGRAVIDFTSADEADVTFVDGAAAKVGSSVPTKRSKHKRERREFVPYPSGWGDLGAHWPHWKGKITRLSEQSIGSLYQKFDVYFEDVTWELDQSLSGEFGATYRLGVGVKAKVVFHQYESNSGCNTDGQETWPIYDGSLRISRDGAYIGNLGGSGATATSASVTVTMSCPGAPPIYFEVARPVSIDFGYGSRFQIKNYYPHCFHLRSYVPKIKGYRLIDETPLFLDLVWWNFDAVYDHDPLDLYCN